MKDVFGRDDLDALDADLLARATRVVPMLDVHRGAGAPGTIALRHDVDDNRGSLEVARRLARWEARRGYRATYFLLHGSHYWRRAPAVALELAELGHEVGIHVNAIAESLRSGGDPETILHGALHELRSTGVPIIGAAAHGDPLCYAEDGSLRFVNDEIFIECRRPALGPVPRTITDVESGRSVEIVPLPLAAFGLEYESSRLSRDAYISDSGGTWSNPLADTVRRFEDPLRLHMLIHPDWWARAFALEGGHS